MKNEKNLTGKRSDNMASNSQTMNINDFVTAFLTDHKDSESSLVDEWNTDEVQVAFTAVVVKAMKAVSRKSSGKKKDKNKPKRGSSAYIFFCGEERANVKTDNPDMSAKEVVAELGARWNQLKLDDEDEIARLQGLASLDKERYLKEMETYEPPADDSDDDEKKPKKKKKTTKRKGPKRGKSAYLFFCEQERKRLKEDEPDLPPKEVTAKMGVAWQELKTDDDRSDEMTVFTDLAAADKARYLEEKENWVDSDDDAGEKPVKKAPKTVAKKKASTKTDEKKPTKKATSSGKKKSGIQMFSTHHRAEVKEENPDMKAGEVTKELSRMWKELDATEKKEWTAKGKE